MAFDSEKMHKVESQPKRGRGVPSHLLSNSDISGSLPMQGAAAEGRGACRTSSLCSVSKQLPPEKSPSPSCLHVWKAWEKGKNQRDTPWQGWAVPGGQARPPLSLSLDKPGGRAQGKATSVTGVVLGTGVSHNKAEELLV